MKLIAAFIALVTTAIAQDSTQLRSPLTGWIDKAPKWTAANIQRQTAEGRIRPVTLDEGALELFTTNDGERVALFSLESPGAFATRVHFEDVRVPADGKVFVYGLDSNGQITRITGPFTASGPLQAGEFWTKAIPGSRIVVEVQSQHEFATLPFTIREISEVDGIDEADATVESQGAVERRVSVYRGMAIEHSVIDGMAVWQGDILLGRPEELERFSGDAKQLERSAWSIAARWSGGVVPYTINANVTNQQRITDAIAHWNTSLNGHLRIVPRTNESAYVTFVLAAASTCSSYVGPQNWAGQPINIGDNCSTGNVIHEIGHAVGLYHEHTRTDRAPYVSIMTANINPNAISNFTAVTGQSQSAYDYGSIMHYGAYAFSINGQPTIIQLQSGPTIGQRVALSAGDINGVKLMYPASGGTNPPPPPPPPTTVVALLATNPSGRTLTVDGSNLVAPASVVWTSGTNHTVSAPNQTVAGTNYVFAGWSDGGAQTHSVAAGTSNLSLTATYAKRHLLSLTGNSVSASPSSPDGYYAEGSTVQLTATPNNRNKCFAGWNGIIAANSPTISLTMTQPYSVSASFQNGAVWLGPSVTLSAAAQAASASVMASSGCVWVATTNTSWITLQTTSGRGSGVVSFVVSQNTTGARRTGSVLINGAPITVTQN